MAQLPEFFSLDIGNHSIKAAQMSGHGEQPKLERIGGVDLEVSILDDASEKGIQSVVDQIKEVMDMADIRTKNAVAAIPEAPVFSRLLSVPRVEDQDFEETVMWQLRSLIPVPLSDVDVAFLEVAEREDNQQGQSVVDVYAVAAPKTLTERFQNVAKEAGINLLALETESLANARAVSQGGYGQQDVMIIDFGANGTNLILSNNGIPVFAQSVSTGSDAFTRAIAAEYGIDVQQAEKYKRTYGIDFNKGEGKIARAIEPVAKILLNEMSRTLIYFRERIQTSSTGETTKILMCGEAAKLPGLPEYLTKNLGINAYLFNPLENLKTSRDAQKSLEQISPIGYSVAIGLALKQN